jgi:hypothetical protein
MSQTRARTAMRATSMRKCFILILDYPWPPLTTLDHPQGRIFPGKLERIFQLFNFNLFEKYQLTDELYPTLTTLDQSSSPFTPL